VGNEKKTIPQSAVSLADTPSASGWDPYEVWRTRVFLPRVASEERDRLARNVSAPTLYVVAQAVAIEKKALLIGEQKSSASAPSDHDVLRHELVHVIGSLWVAGLVNIFLNSSDRQRHR
jgi:hypothetical protein